MILREYVAMFLFSYWPDITDERTLFAALGGYASA